VLAESQQAVQLAVTAGAGDLATAGLLMLRRVSDRRRTSTATASGAPPLIDVAGMRWETLSQLLAWAWQYLGYEVEITDIRSGGVVDFILTDSGGYTYVQARRWQQPEVTSNDIARLRADMTLTGVHEGIWMTSGAFTPQARQFAKTSGIRLVGAEELAVMVDRIAARIELT